MDELKKDVPDMVENFVNDQKQIPANKVLRRAFAQL